MDLEKIEEDYKKGLDVAEKEFKSGLKNKGNTKELEKRYQNKLNSLRKHYYNSINSNLKKQGIYKKKKKSATKKEKFKTFKVHPGKFELSIFQKLKFKIHLLKFKVGFWIRNFLRNKTPEFISFNYLKIKIKSKKLFSKLSDLTADSIEKTKDLSQKTFEKSKSLIKIAYKKTMEFPSKIIEKFSKKKESSKDKKLGAQTTNKKIQKG